MRFVYILLIFSLLASNMVLADSDESYRNYQYEQWLDKTKPLYLDLHTVLTKVLHKNLTLKIKNYDINIARNDSIKAASNFLPDITLSHTLSENGGSIQGFGSSLIDIEQNTVRTGAQFKVGLFEGGKVFFGFLSEINKFQAEKNIYDSQKQQLLFEALEQYLNLIVASDQIISEQDRLNQAKQNLEEREIAVKYGTDIRLSVLIAKRELELAKANLRKFQASFYSMSEKLSDTLNIDKQYLILPIDEFKQALLDHDFVYWPKEKNNIGEFMAIASSHNPQILAQNDLLDSAKYTQLQSLSAFLPRASFTTEFNVIGSTYSFVKGRDFYALNLEYDVLNNLGGEAISNFNISRNQKLQAKIELYKLLSELRMNIAQDYLSFEANKAVFLSNEAILDMTKEAYRDAKIRLEEGLGTSYELSIAQSDLAEARSGYYSSIVDYRLSQAQLLKDMGVLSVHNLENGYGM